MFSSYGVSVHGVTLSMIVCYACTLDGLSQERVEPAGEGSLLSPKRTASARQPAARALAALTHRRAMAFIGRHRRSFVIMTSPRSGLRLEIAWCAPAAILVPSTDLHAVNAVLCD